MDSSHEIRTLNKFSGSQSPVDSEDDWIPLGEDSGQAHASNDDYGIEKLARGGRGHGGGHGGGGGGGRRHSPGRSIWGGSGRHSPRLGRGILGGGVLGGLALGGLGGSFNACRSRVDTLTSQLHNQTIRRSLLETELQGISTELNRSESYTQRLITALAECNRQNQILRQQQVGNPTGDDNSRTIEDLLAAFN
jgi:hypothetical protein